MNGPREGWSRPMRVIGLRSETPVSAARVLPQVVSARPAR
jgi:hypothetical protein